MESHQSKDKKRSAPSLADSYRRMQQIAGNEAPALRASINAAAISSVMQGLAFASIFPLVTAVLTKPLDMNAVWLWIGVFAALSILDWIFRWRAHDFGYSEKMPNITHDLRVKLGTQLRKMPLQTLYKSRTGSMATVVAGNVDEVIIPMGSIAEMFVRSIVVPVVVVLATFFISWKLAIAMLLIFPMAIPLYRLRREFVGKFVRDLSAAHANTSAEIVEYAQGLPVLRAANATGSKAERLQAALKQLQDLQVKSQMSSILPNFALWTLIEGGIVVVLAVGVYLILGQTLSIAALAALLVMSVRLSESIAILTNVTEAIDLMEAGFEKIEEMFSIEPLAQKLPVEQPQHFDIVFNDLTFSYEQGERPELKNINITLPERSMTALVGPSGSGKTTLTRMIMRYADAQTGSVSIGGVDVRSISQDELMQQISVVFQDVYLFDDTIIANIRMGKPDATDAEVETAARAANCHEFISRLPDGYQTTVGDIGGTLSGGERQRISIARAILKDAPIVMLDEPTAALDTESEVAVQKAIDTLVENRTIIVIAHRLSTIVGADQILVMDEGELVQIGKHEELITQDGRYRAMWQAQQEVKNWHMVPHHNGGVENHA